MSRNKQLGTTQYFQPFHVRKSKDQITVKDLFQFHANSHTLSYPISWNSGLAYIDRVPENTETKHFTPRNKQLGTMQYFQPFHVRKSKDQITVKDLFQFYLRSSELVCAQDNNNKLSITVKCLVYWLRGISNGIITVNRSTTVYVCSHIDLSIRSLK